MLLEAMTTRVETIGQKSKVTCLCVDRGFDVEHNNHWSGWRKYTGALGWSLSLNKVIEVSANRRIGILSIGVVIKSRILGPNDS